MTRPRPDGPRRWRALGALVVSGILLAIGTPELGAAGSAAPAPRLAPLPQAPGGYAAAPATTSWAVHAPSECAGHHPATEYPLRASELAMDLHCAFSLGRAVPPPGVSASPSGSSGTSGPPAFGMYNQALTYDTADGYLLLFGATGSGPLNGTETWAFAGGNWTQLHPNASPESCVGSVMAYDSFDDYVLYLAGGNLTPGSNCISAGQTWEFRAGNWTQLHPASSPPPSQAATLTNDSAEGYMLLFGGACDLANGTMTLCGGTWSYRAGNWTNISRGTQPWPRAGAGMTYDATDGYVVLFGGDYWPVTTPWWPIMLADTWIFKGGNWSQVGDCGGPGQNVCPGNYPPEPWPDGMTYDAASGEVLYTCSRLNTTGGPESFYTFHHGQWHNPNYAYSRGWYHGAAPSNRLAEGLAYDYRDGYAVLYGGISTSWQLLNDTWAFSDGRWTNITSGVGLVNATFREWGLPSGTNWSVAIAGRTLASATDKISIRLKPGTYAYRVGTVANYSTVANGSLEVTGVRTGPVNISFHLVRYRITFDERGLARGTYWQVVLNGSGVAAAGRSIAFTFRNGSYGFVAYASGYTASPASGTVTVAGTRVTVTITFS